MELVLGLATLATAISGATGAGHYDNAPEIKEAEPETVHVTDNLNQQEIQGVDDLISETHLSDLSESESGKVDFDQVGRIVPEKKPHPLSNPEKENNNRVKNANDISGLMAVYSDWDFNNYGSNSRPYIGYTTMNGTIASTKDVDWYSFTLFGITDLDIKLSGIANNCNYNITLYKKSNLPDAGEEDVVQIASSKNSSNFDERIKVSVYPGVYYVKVDAVEGYGATKYYLYCAGTYRFQEDVCIEDWDYYGAKGALWLSDYDPFGIQPSSDMATHKVGTDDKTPYLLPFLWKNTYHPEFPYELDKQYKQAEFFIWDLDLRASFRNVVNDLITHAENDKNDAVGLYMNMQKIEAAGNIILTIVGETCGKIASWTISAYGIGMDMLSFLFPEGDRFEDFDKLIAYYKELRGNLKFTQETFSGIEKEVVRIPVYYHITDKYTPIDTIMDTADGPQVVTVGDITSYSLVYAPKIVDDPDFLYTDGDKELEEDRYIHAVDHEGDSPFTGTIYPLVNGGSVKKALRRNYFFDTSSEELVLGEPATLSLQEGMYKWYSFTAPHSGRFRIRSSGDYRAAVHVASKIDFGPTPFTYPFIASEYRTAGYVDGFSYVFRLNAGEKLYFRVCGSLQDYTSLLSTTVTIDELLNTVINFDGSALGLGYEWNDDYRANGITSPANIDVTSRGAFVCEENGFVELKVDKNGPCSYAFLYLRFDRPIKSIGFSTAIANSYSYACLAMHIYGDDSWGEGIVVDSTDFSNNNTVVYGDYYLTRYVLNYDNAECDVGIDIYGVAFVLDPDTDTSPYHVSYQEQWLTDFTVEFAN